MSVERVIFFKKFLGFFLTVFHHRHLGRATGGPSEAESKKTPGVLFSWKEILEPRARHLSNNALGSDEEKFGISF